MGQLIDFGQKVQKVGIDRFDCVEGITVKGILLNYAKPYARNIAYDEVNRCFVECTKEMAIKYNLNPSPRYYFVLASFATDANNNILGDKEQRVTYIHMSNNQYEHFLAASNNLVSWHGYVTLQKKKQKGNNGKDFSFVESTPADDNADGFKGVSQALKTRIDRLVNDNNFINTAVQLIDSATGLYEDKYLERIEQNKLRQQQNNAQPVQQPNAPTQAAVGGNTAYVTKQQPQLPQQPTPPVQQPDDFGAEVGQDLPF